MKNMLISSNNKNPLINFERNQQKHPKPQISIGLKVSLKCMKKEIKPKKKGQNSLTSARRQKLLWKIEGKRQKFVFESRSVEERERENSFLKLLK